MTKLEIQAVRDMPQQYVKDGIVVEQMNKGYVLVISQMLPILRYDPITRQFTRHRRS